VQRTPEGVRVQIRLLSVTTRQSAFAKEYSGTAANARLYAHTIADEIHKQQRALRGVARTKLAFSSDRTRDRVSGAVANRDVKEIFVSDYDGGNQQRVTNTRQLNNFPSWSPDARAVAYTSYRRFVPDIYISRIYQGILENPLKGEGANYLPVWSPDGTRIAFWSNRDGNPEIYVMNRDGSGVRRLTNHPAGESSPTWSPNGAQIAFTSDRAGQPQIYVMSSTDGSGLRPTPTAPRGRRRRSTRSRSRPRRADRATTSRSSTWRPGRSGRSPTGTGRTKARPIRRAADTWRSRPPAVDERRSTPSAGTVRGRDR
jgi:TolB protein